jgi:hypothetical protein
MLRKHDFRPFLLLFSNGDFFNPNLLRNVKEVMEKEVKPYLQTEISKGNLQGLTEF